MYKRQDVTAQYNFSDSYILYAQAKGGKRQNDFRRIGEFCPYGQVAPQPDATYEQLNAALGFKASPIDGLWFNIYGGYQDLKNELYFSPDESEFTETGRFQMLRIGQQNMSDVYAGAEISYAYKNIIAFTASGIYRDWDTSGKEGREKGTVLAYKPAFEGNFRIDVRPVPTVLVNLGYQHISREKADAYRSIMQPGELLITADTIVWLDGKVLGKPEGREGAVEMLRSLSGKSHQVFTGVCLTTTEWQKSFTAASDVEFDVLSEEEIRYYVDKYQPMDKAGAYGVQEWIGYIGVKSISGSFYNIMGLPIQKLYGELKKL